MSEIESWLAQCPPTWTLLAGVPGGLIPVAGGRTLAEIAALPPSHLSLHQWAAAGILVHADTPRVLVSAQAGAAAYAGDELELGPLESDDLEGMAFLWRVQDERACLADLDELRLRMYAWLAVDGGDACHEAVATAVAHRDARRLAELAGQPLVDLQRAPGKNLWNVGVLAEYVPGHLPPFTSENDYRERLARLIPPRWIIADPIRRAGRPDLADVVVGARSIDDCPF